MSRTEGINLENESKKLKTDLPSDWEYTSIGECGLWKGGGTPSKSKSEFWNNGTIPWASSQDISNGDLSTTTYTITKEALYGSTTNLIPSNSVIVVMRSGILRHSFPVMKNTIEITINQDLKALIPYESVYYDYVYHQLRLNEKRILNDCSKTGTTVESIEFNSLKLFCIPLPPKYEQIKIAEILSTWDKAIELKEKLIEEKKNQKIGLMQKLLTGKVRLPGFEEEWKVVKLGDIMKNKTAKTVKNNQYQILSCTKDGVVSQSEHFNKQIASINNIGYKILKKGEVVLSPMNLWIGGIDISNFDIGIVSPAYKVYKVNYSVIGENYLRTLLRSEYMLGLYDSISQKGASIVRRNLSIKDFEALTIKIPNDFEEMNAIEKALYISSREMVLLSSELEYLKKQKKGLMQLLLTGIVRVNTREN
jgi:type I restriction enzyme S subunit